MARRAWWNWTVVFPVVDGGSGGVAPNFDPFHAFSRLGLAFLASTTTPKAQYSLGSPLKACKQQESFSVM